jgi:hypothetical protein
MTEDSTTTTTNLRGPAKRLYQAMARVGTFVRDVGPRDLWFWHRPTKQLQRVLSESQSSFYRTALGTLGHSFVAYVGDPYGATDEPIPLADAIEQLVVGLDAPPLQLALPAGSQHVSSVRKKYVHARAFSMSHRGSATKRWRR